MGLRKVNEMINKLIKMHLSAERNLGLIKIYKIAGITWSLLSLASGRIWFA